MSCDATSCFKRAAVKDVKDDCCIKRGQYDIAMGCSHMHGGRVRHPAWCSFASVGRWSATSECADVLFVVQTQSKGQTLYGA